MTKPTVQQEAQNDLVLSYNAVRRAIGFIGLALPPGLMIAVWLAGNPFQSSISAYYYTGARDVFVGAMCAAGVFLWSYVGYEDPEPKWPSDKLVSRVAAAAAFLVALVPTADKTPDPAAVCTVLECLVNRFGADTNVTVHYVAASVYLWALAIMCLVNFRRTGNKALTPEKRAKNKVFSACGWVMAGSLLLLFGYGFVYGRADEAGKAWLDSTLFVFVMEWIATWAFAIAWLVKGEMLAALPKTVERITAG